MGLTITPVRWKLRWGPDHERYGDGYTGAGDLIKIGSEGWIEGMAGSGFTKAIRERIQQFCAAHGMPHVRWERFHNGKLELKEWTMDQTDQDTYTVIVNGFTVLKNGELHHSGAPLVYAGMKKAHMKALQAAMLSAFGQLNENS